MRIEKFTQRAQEALASAQELLTKFQHQEMDTEHLLYALLTQEDGVVPEVVRKLDANPDELAAAVKAELESRPKVYDAAPSGQIYVSQRAQSVLRRAQEQAEAMKDEFTSTEHLLLGIAGERGSPAARLLGERSINRDRILQALKKIRGTQRVTSPEAEGQYQALEKYSRDLTELARQNKLDQIGRAHV
jgi:ATP-dependent Clp protease ATP-binding subunit ClpA